VLPIDEVVEAAGESFQLQSIVAPRLLSGDLPVRIPVAGELVTAATLGEAHEALDDALSRLTSTLQLLEARVIDAVAGARSIHQMLADAATSLLDAGSQIHREGGFDEAMAQDFLAAMKAVDVACTQLAAAAPDTVRKAIGGLMRHLTSSTYLISETEHPDWGIERREVAAHLVAVSGAIDDVAPPNALRAQST